MLGKVISTAALVLFGISAYAQTNPATTVVQGLTTVSNGNGFAGTNSTCLTGIGFTKGSGPILGGRQCIGAFARKADVEAIVQQAKAIFVFRNQYIDLIQIPNNTLLLGGNVVVPKGNIYYLVHYDDAGNVGEATAFNDALQ